MKELIREIKAARRRGRLNYKFTPRQVAQACRSKSASDWSSILFRHRVGNADRRTAHFTRHPDGLFSLLDEDLD